ncbi:MAG: hypothetical protein ACUVXI_05015 [bacterium]
MERFTYPKRHIKLHVASRWIWNLGIPMFITLGMMLCGPAILSKILWLVVLLVWFATLPYLWKYVFGGPEEIVLYDRCIYLKYLFLGNTILKLQKSDIVSFKELRGSTIIVETKVDLIFGKSFVFDGYIRNYPLLVRRLEEIYQDNCAHRDSLNKGDKRWERSGR